jgi:alkylation response protein AidB-like acyl-CoA dehydrogenase
MRLRLTPEEERFRDEVRAVLAALDLGDRGRSADRDACCAWQRALAQRGWAVPNWPVALGGAGWTRAQWHIFMIEAAAAGAPLEAWVGVTVIGPLLCAHGTAAQRARLLPPILRGEAWWCLGLAEARPDIDHGQSAIRAVRRGEGYALSGTVLCRAEAAWADGILCLAAASPDAVEEGLCLLLLDLRACGVTRHVRRGLGERDLVEIRLDEAPVPAANRIGREGEGLDGALCALHHHWASGTDLGRLRRLCARLQRLAAETRCGGGWLSQEPHFARDLAAMEIAREALEVTAWRGLAAEAAENIVPDPALLRLGAIALEREVNALLLRAAGPYAVPAPEASNRSGHNLPLGPQSAAGAALSWFDLNAAAFEDGAGEIPRALLAASLFGS